MIDEDSVTDEELLVGERTALDAFFDTINTRRIAQTLWFFTCIQAVYAIVMFGSGELTRGAVAGVVVLGDLLLLRHRNAPAVSRNIRQTAAAVLIGHLVVLQVFHLSLIHISEPTRH